MIDIQREIVVAFYITLELYQNKVSGLNYEIREKSFSEHDAGERIVLRVEVITNYFFE